jgi:starch phosphorylase
MSYQIQPIKEFLVRPALPAKLERLNEIAYNLLWSWDHSVRAVFRRLDPALWKSCGHNPVLFLGRVSQDLLEKAANDSRYVAVYRRACQRLDQYLSNESEYKDGRLIAYFSMEYGLVDCMQIYSGGLGVLSGDHLKASSDAGFPLVAIGLLYQKGYLTQRLNPDGVQQERYPVNDFYTLPVKPYTREDGSEMFVHVKLPGGEVAIKVWVMEVGRVRLFLLDTNVAENKSAEDREITDQLYGGDSDKRIRQEIVLGIGGMRCLRALGIEPTVFHMNEGHSAFLAIERIRLLMQEHGLRFEEALEASRRGNVFTTHTSVPAGIDLFDTGMMYAYFEPFCRENGIPFDQFLALGRYEGAGSGDPFSMAIFALRCSALRNAVSRLHREVSQNMWQGLWPKLPVWEVPITSVTNGVHLPSWLSGDLAQVYDQTLAPEWRDGYTDAKIWEQVDDIPSQDLWEAHRRRKRALTTFVRERTTASALNRKASPSEQRRMAEVLDPDAFTIGFARRFATYKRATLLLHDRDRLRQILTNPKRPVQVVIAGKAHPRDMPGKMLIREIVQLSRDPELSRRLVFLEDYGMDVARELVQGVDIWLNTPRRGEEACGTSGMKSAMNGVLNLSILDGWFDEAFENSGGWAIGDREPYSPEQDEAHARAIYSLLENEIVPMYYERNDAGVPEEWVRRMKQSLRFATPRFNCLRMIHEYMTEMYGPAHMGWSNMRANEFEAARSFTRWTEQISGAWDRIRFVEIGPGPDGPVLTGTAVPLRAVVDLAGLSPSDVRVEAVIGRIGATGKLEDTQVMLLRPSGQQGQVYTYSDTYIPSRSGRLGYSLRISPNHYDDPLTRPCHCPLKWGSE